MKQTRKNARFSRGPHFDQNTHIPEEEALRDGCRALKKGAVLQFRFRENPSKKLKKTASTLNTHSAVHFQKIHVFPKVFNDSWPALFFLGLQVVEGVR